MDNATCPIWGTPATKSPSEREGWVIKSVRAGGTYFISGRGEAVLRSQDTSVKALLTSWIIEQKRLGVQRPEILAETVEKVKQRRPLSIPERADCLLEHLGQFLSHPGDTYVHPTYEDKREKFYYVLARLESAVEVGEIERQRGEIQFFFDHLEKQGLIDKYDPQTFDKDIQYSLTVAGYARLEELRHTTPSSSRCFVAMWFDDSMQQARDEGILPAIRDTGYDPVVIDQKEHINKIDDEIIAEIRRARFVVADFTHGEKGARGGVYYEAGFAFGLNIPVIFTCHKDIIGDVHFDTRQYNHIVWDSPEDLRNKLGKRISAVIGDGPISPNYPAP